MTITIPKPTTVEAVAVKVIAPVRFCEEDIPNDFPGRSRDMWEAVIDLQTGAIQGWPKGRTAEMCMKVADGGIYTLEGDGKVIATHEGYVPDFFPGDHYGDYLQLTIDADGFIADWSVDESDIRKAFFPSSDDR